MGKMKKLFTLLFVVVFAFVLFGCNKPEETGEVVLKVNCDIFEGTADDPYMLLNGDTMVLSATNNGIELSDVEWTVSNDKVAVALVEKNTVELSPKKAGTAIVTCTYKNDKSKFVTKKVSVYDSLDYNSTLLKAKAELLSKLPTYITGNYTFPVLENDLIKVTYTNSINVEYPNGVYTYSYVEDCTLPLKVILELNKTTLSFSVDSVKIVKDEKKNSYEAFKYAKEEITKDMNKLMKAGAGSLEYDIDDKLETFYTDSATKLQALKLINGFTASQAGAEVKIVWTCESTSDPILIKQNADNTYYLTYAKPLVDKTCLITALLYSGTGSDIMKFNLTAKGYTADDVYNYAVEKLSFPVDGTSTTKTYIKVPVADTLKKFPKLTIEWTADETVIKFNESQSLFRLVDSTKKGDVVLKAILYYGKTERQAFRDKLDESGNPVKDEKGQVVQEEFTEIVCDWKKEVSVTVTFK